MNSTSNFNLQANGDCMFENLNCPEDKLLNTEEELSLLPPILTPKTNATITSPPPIPPKSLSLNDKKDSVDNITTPSTNICQDGGSKNENYSVPRLQSQRQ